jgi:hypothetical protein
MATARQQQSKHQAAVHGVIAVRATSAIHTFFSVVGMWPTPMIDTLHVVGMWLMPMVAWRIWSHPFNLHNRTMKMPQQLVIANASAAGYCECLSSWLWQMPDEQRKGGAAGLWWWHWWSRQLSSCPSQSS